MHCGKIAYIQKSQQKSPSSKEDGSSCHHDKQDEHWIQFSIGESVYGSLQPG